MDGSSLPFVETDELKLCVTNTQTFYSLTKHTCN